MRGYRLLQESILREQSNATFVPFVDERDHIGKLKGVPVRSLSRHARKLTLPERKKSQTAKPSLREKRTRFLKEIYTTHQSDWNALTRVRKMESMFQLKLETDEELQKPLLMLNAKLVLKDVTQKRCTMSIPNSPRLGKQKTQSTIPPLGYYEVKEIVKKQPMLVFMDMNKTPRDLSPTIQSPPKSEQSSRQQRTQKEKTVTYQLDKNLLEKAYETERMLTDQRYRFVPQHLDLKSLEQSSNRIKSMRLKIRNFKQQS